MRVTGENLTAFATIPATYRLSENMRINVNGGWLWDRFVDRHYLTLRHRLRLEIHRDAAMDHRSVRSGRPIGRTERGAAAFQTGVRYRPNEIFSVDLIYGHNITGENANWITLGTTIRFPVRGRQNPSASAPVICERTRSKRTSREDALPEFVKIEKGLGPEGRIAVVRFDRGDGINALSPEAMRQLTNAARSFEDDATTSVVVLTGGAKGIHRRLRPQGPEGRARGPWTSARCAGT